MYILYYYFVIGVMLNLIYECINWWLNKKTKFDGKLTDIEKLLALIFWPLGLIVFLDAFFKQVFKKK